LDELFELLLELLFDERRVGWSGATPMARAARFMPFSQPLKKPCTALSPRGLLRLLFELLLLDALELRFEEELDDELDEEFEDEFEEEFDDELEEELDEEFELPLELLFELLLPALILSGFTLCSTSCATSARPLADIRPCACAPVPATRPATAVTITPSCCFMEVLFAGRVAESGSPALVRRPGSDATTRSRCRLFRGGR
jgi:hypothetical protein